MSHVARIGAVEIDRVFDSYLLGETMQGWFPDFTIEAVEPHKSWLCPCHYDAESGRIPMPVHSWLLRIGKTNVLIDTCIGNHKQRPDKFEMHMLNTRYIERLKALGTSPEDIHYVLCTHLHLDHVGWNTVLENGRWVPTFPNAKYVFSRAEYEATKREAEAAGTPPFLRHVFEDSIFPVVEAGKAVLVDGIHELLDTLTLRPAPGHSPGNVRIELASGGELGVFAGDMLHSPIQVPIWAWSSRVCWDRDRATRSRRELLEFCASENALLLPGHFEAPHFGRIKADGDGFRIEFGL